MFDVFKAGRAGNLFLIAPFPDLCLLVPFLITPCPNFNKCCALSHLKHFFFHFYSKNAFSERKLFLNTFELYLLERHVTMQKFVQF